MPKPNTLFAYFQKSPKNIEKSISENGNGKIDADKSKTPSRSPKRLGNNRSKVEAKSNQEVSPELIEFKLYDILWAKIEGHPWWPSLVCRSPDYKDNNSFFSNKNKKAPKIHVQFFDEPPTRAWVKTKLVKPFTGPRHIEIPSLKDPKWKTSVEKAAEALQKSSLERQYLVAKFEEKEGTPESENDNSDDEVLDVTPKQSGNAVHKRSLSNGCPPQNKKRRIIIESDSEEEEFKPNPEELSDSEVGSSCVESGVEDSPEEEESPQKILSKKRKATFTPSSTNKSTKKHASRPSLNASISKLNSSFSSTQENSTFGGSDSKEERQWLHLSEKADFLSELKRKDSQGRLMSHPDYDPRTLYIPDSFKKSLTPAMRQWWSMKSQHFDSVLFFKVGKFYELYHMDAVIGVNELGLNYMKGEIAHSGFPEIAYKHFSELLIGKSYKVARVEQTETPQMMEERIKHMGGKPTKNDRVVNREVCRITTQGTRTFSHLEGAPTDSKNHFLLALAEKVEPDSGNSHYGVSFVDTSIGLFYLGQFEDDRNCSRLRTLVAHYPPSQVLYEKTFCSPKTQNILNNCLASATKEALRPGLEFWDATKTLKFLSEGNYFNDENVDSNQICWPEALKQCIDPDDCIMQTAKESSELSLKALGACCWYLKDCKIEEELLSMRKFQNYLPPDQAVRLDENISNLNSKYLVLDGVSLVNLEILENESGGTEGSLLKTMNYCSTPFGKRLFRQWICAPLCDPCSINDRLDAVEDLLELPEIMEKVVSLMKTLPDLERLLSRIHTQGSARRNEKHPDSRAIFYEDITYNKRKITDFLLALEGFKTSIEIIDLFKESKDGIRSELLKKCVTSQNEAGYFPDLKSILLYFETAFDHENAKKEGKIIPSRGVDKDFDDSENEIKQTEKELKKQLEIEQKHFGCKVSFYGTGKNRFQLEVPDHATKRATSKHDLQSQRKGYKRYWTPTVKALLGDLTTAEESRDEALKDIMRRIFASFDKEIQKWDSVVHCLSVLDALLSLALYNKHSSVEMCRPEIKIPIKDQKPFLEIIEGRHPALITVLEDSFVPNGISIGLSEDNSRDNNESSLVLVTGPNMGGKSTLMREAGLLVIMAQMGSYVPAQKCSLTAVDRVFTRLGANDRIIEGESTFFVELSETSSILNHATQNSLVLLDELGRGTATYDGTAIAFAVVHKLLAKRCRTLFSTHYHSLVDEFKKDSRIYLGHMACMVENENNEDPTQETITFLHKFVSGACPKSYGFNAARLAGVPDMVVRDGYKKAKELESNINQLKLLRSILQCQNYNQLKKIKFVI